ncbi:hypothetical protein SMB554_24950 (plasmid) [Sinorhizobium meliloti]|nr:hypothetical protein SMB554_24950 [Sinorhizobium meliloti]
MAGSPQPDELGLALVVTIRTCLRELLLYERLPAELSSTASSNHSRSGKSRSVSMPKAERNVQKQLGHDPQVAAPTRPI